MLIKKKLETCLHFSFTTSEISECVSVYVPVKQKGSEGQSHPGSVESDQRRSPGGEETG